MDFPSVLFVSSSDYPAVNVIEKVFDSPLPEKIKLDKNVTGYQWHIDNKYYSADINLCDIDSKIISEQTFADSVEAVVLNFDSDSAQGLDLAESWLPFIDVYEAEIKILVCQRCHDEEGNGFVGVSKHSALEWCVDKGFELVELDPNPADIDPEDDFPETVGVERIRQALNAHRWPNLVMKADDGNGRSNQAAAESTPNLAAELEETFGELIENFDDFGALFSQISEVKARIAHLSGDERKRAAEEAVMAFCAAMGQDGEDL